MSKLELEKKIEIILSEMKLELVKLVLGSNGVIQVFIDNECGGVTSAICEKVSRQLNRFLLVENFSYNRLEVSSPGLERPLTKTSDYQRFMGKRIKVTVVNEDGIKQRFEADIVDVNLAAQAVVLKNIGKELVSIPFSNIEKARLVYKL